MSVVINGWSKPKECAWRDEKRWHQCPFLDLDNNARCNLQSEDYETWEEQYAACPIYEISEEPTK